MSQQLKMTHGHPGRLLLKFALPLMLGNVFQQLYTVLDTAIVGQGVGMNALASLGTVDWLNWMFIGIAQGFTQGFSVRTAQKYGEGDIEGVKRSAGVSLWLSLCIGIGLSMVSQLGLNGLLTLLKVPDTLRPGALEYSRILLAGLPVVMYFNYCASILRAVGDSKTPLYAMMAAALTNIVLDCIAVFVLGWGIAGAAVATVIAQCLSAAVCTLKLLKTPVLRFEKRHMKPQNRDLGKLLLLGIPVALQNIVISIGGMVVQSVVNHFDTAFIAGFTSSNKLYGVLEIAALSYGYAVTTYTGQNYGARLWERIRSGIRWAVVISLITATVISGIMIALGRPITMLFISREDAELAAQAGEVAYRYLFVMSAALPVLYLLYAYRSALQGMGNTVIPLLSGVLELVIRVGCAIVISLTGFRDGLLCIEVLAWVAAAALLATAYYVCVARLGKK